MLAIPLKRHEQSNVTYLDRDEIEALLAAPDRTTWLGRRDHALLLTAIQTGVRVSELVALRIRRRQARHRRARSLRGKRRKQTLRHR